MLVGIVTLMHEGNAVREFYRMRLARSPAHVSDAGDNNGRSGERSHRIDALVSESHGGAVNRMPGRPPRRDSSGGAPEAENKP